MPAEAVVCPSCQASLKVSAEQSAVATIRCPHCQSTIGSEPKPAATLRLAASSAKRTPFSSEASPPAADTPRETLPLIVNDQLPKKAGGAPIQPKDGTQKTIGRFVLGELLGEGAFGEVFKAYDPQLDRTVAIKIAKLHQGDSASRTNRFLREAKAAANLRHPYIVPVHEFGQEGDRFYIVSSFIEGRTLQADLAAAGEAKRPPDLPRAVRIVRQLAEALAYAHSQEIVHRDVKPANVMLDAKDEPMLMDFGLASRGAKEQELTRDGHALGTPLYMSPEQADGQGVPINVASDQYSLGVMFYEMIAGHPPFAGTAELVMFHHANTEPPRPRGLNSKISLDLQAICLKCLEKNPARRYASAADFATDLRRYLEGDPISARRTGPVARTIKWARRKPARAAVVGLFFLLTLGGLTSWIVIRGSQAREQQAIDNTRQSLNHLFTLVEVSHSLGADQRETLLEELQRDRVFYKKQIAANPKDKQLREELAEIEVRLAWLEALNLKGNNGSAFDENYIRALRALKNACSAYVDLVAENPDPKLRVKLANCQSDLGFVYNLLGETDDSKKSYRACLDLRNKLVNEFPSRISFLRALDDDQWAFCAMLRGGRSDSQEAKAAFAQAWATQKKLNKAEQDATPEGAPERYLNTIAVLTHRGADIDAFGITPEAEEMYDAVMKYCLKMTGVNSSWRDTVFKGEQLPKLYDDKRPEKLAHLWPWPAPQKSIHDRTLEFYTRLLAARPSVANKCQLARCSSFNARFILARWPKEVSKEALELASNSCRLYEELLADDPNNKTYALESAQLCTDVAALLENSKRIDEAATWCRRGRVVLERGRVSKDEPLEAKLTWRNLCIASSVVSFGQKRYIESLENEQMAFDIDGDLRKTNRDRYVGAVNKARSDLYSLARRGNFEQALADVERIVVLRDAPGEALYDCACVYGCAAKAAKDEQLREKRGARSVQLLRQAFAAGFFSHPLFTISGVGINPNTKERDPVWHMERDADLVEIRARDDYRQLLAEVSGKKW